MTTATTIRTPTPTTPWARAGGAAGKCTVATAAGAMPFDYLRDPAAISALSFARVRAEAKLGRFEPAMRPVAARIVHACGMPDIADDLRHTPGVAETAHAALKAGAAVITDGRMTAHGITKERLPAANAVVCAIDDPRTKAIAADLGTTRAAAAVELWDTAGSLIAIGNAPTALFRLLEKLAAGAAAPAAVIAFPVGFVGAAESRAALTESAAGVPYLTLTGRRGGSAMAAAAVNAIAAPAAP